MWVFVDESGDTGFDLPGSSQDWFLVCAVVFESREAMDECERRMAELRKDLGLAAHKEFHFTADNERIRRAGLEAIKECDWWAESVELRKNSEDAGGLRGNPLHGETLRRLFAAIAGRLERASVKLDGTGDRPFRNLKRKQTSAGARAVSRSALRKVKTADSSDHTLLQVADYVAGALSHDVRVDRDLSYLRLIKEKIRGRHRWSTADQ